MGSSSCLGAVGAIVEGRLEPRAPAVQLPLPVLEQRGRGDHQVRPRVPLRGEAVQPSKQRRGPRTGQRATEEGRGRGGEGGRGTEALGDRGPGGRRRGGGRNKRGRRGVGQDLEAAEQPEETDRLRRLSESHLVSEDHSVDLSKEDKFGRAFGKQGERTLSVKGGSQAHTQRTGEKAEEEQPGEGGRGGGGADVGALEEHHEVDPDELVVLEALCEVAARRLDLRPRDELLLGALLRAAPPAQTVAQPGATLRALPCRRGGRGEGGGGEEGKEGGGGGGVKDSALRKGGKEGMGGKGVRG